MKNINELRALSSDELQSELMSLRRQQFGLRMKKANGTLDKTHVFAQVRKAIARVKTIMTENGGRHGNE